MHAAGWLPIPVILLLLIMAGGCWFALRLQHKIAPQNLWRTRVAGREWRRIFLIYALAVPSLIAVLWLAKPDAMFWLVRRNPKIWLLVMFAYPIVSVMPQELVYRVFFFERYQPLFGSQIGIVIASAAAFSFGHIVFHNWPAMALTLIGGTLFARTYQRSRSLLIVAVEHALYGCAIFTIGYGEFFLEGTLRLLRWKSGGN